VSLERIVAADGNLNSAFRGAAIDEALREAKEAIQRFESSHQEATADLRDLVNRR
jgi:hypothetical protein